MLGVWGSTRCWAVPQKLSFCRRVNFFPLFRCGELGAQVCPRTSDNLHISKTTQRSIMVRPSHFTVRSGLSDTNGFLLCFRSVTYYEYPVWILAARTHVLGKRTSRGCP